MGEASWSAGYYLAAAGAGSRRVPGGGRAPNQRELASLLDKANLRTRKGKDEVIDWDETERGWQAKAAQKAGVDLALLHQRVSRRERSASRRVTQAGRSRGMTSRAQRKALKKCSRENSRWTRADLIANIGRGLPRRAADPGSQAQLLGDLQHLSRLALDGPSTQTPRSSLG